MEENKISVSEFVDKYYSLSNSLKSNYLKDKIILNDKYVSIGKKIALAKNIVKCTYYTNDKEINGIKTTKFHMNSPLYYMLYCLNLIDMYTNISIDFKNNIVDEYDKLDKYAYIDLLLSNIPKKESKEFEMILKMVGEDVVSNEYETHAFISSQIDKITNVINEISPILLKTIANSLNNIDEKSASKIINMFDKLK